MTAIAGLVDNGKVWIGGDSAGVAGLSLHKRKDPKVFKTGEFVIGFTGSFRIGQILRYHLSPDTPKEGQDGYAYMVCSFVPTVRRVLKDNGCKIEKEGEDRMGGAFLIGWRGDLYYMQADFQIGQLLTPYAACGCGEELVIGSLHATAKMSRVSAKKRVEMALQAAEDFSAGVRGPFTILSTKGGK